MPNRIPVSQSEVQYQLSADSRIGEPEVIARINEFLAAELTKFDKIGTFRVED